jgi:hypothetical protein
LVANRQFRWKLVDGALHPEPVLIGWFFIMMYTQPRTVGTMRCTKKKRPGMTVVD